MLVALIFEFIFYAVSLCPSESLDRSVTMCSGCRFPKKGIPAKQHLKTYLMNWSGVSILCSYSKEPIDLSKFTLTGEFRNFEMAADKGLGLNSLGWWTAELYIMNLVIFYIIIYIGVGILN